MVVAEHFDHVVLRLVVRDAQLPHGAAVLVLLRLREAEATEKVADHLVFRGGVVVAVNRLYAHFAAALHKAVQHGKFHIAL